MFRKESTTLSKHNHFLNFLKHLKHLKRTSTSSDLDGKLRHLEFHGTSRGMKDGNVREGNQIGGRVEVTR